jgi:lipooligosaccharide transport system permease protein
VIQVWLRNFLFFRRTFLVSLFWTVFEPLMYLAAFGFGFGRYIPPIEGLSFLDFYFPGLLCSTAMMVSYFESTYPNYTKLTYQKTFATMLLSPLTHRQILLGEVLWAASKGVLGVVGVMVVSSIFGLFNLKLFFILPILFTLSLIFAAFGLIIVSIARNYDSFIFSTSGFIIPLSLISGTYFSLKDMPQLIQWLAYLFPLSHAVQLVRHIMQNKFEIMTLGSHSLVLVIYAIGLVYLADYLFRRKMIS